MESLENLKPGDKVLISDYVSIKWQTCRTYREAVVERITPSGYIVVEGRLFYKTGLERVSGRKEKIVTIDNEDARSIMEETRKIQIINLVQFKAGQYIFAPTYEQALKIIEIMGWEKEMECL